MAEGCVQECDGWMASPGAGSCRAGGDRRGGRRRDRRCHMNGGPGTVHAQRAFTASPEFSDPE